LRGPCHGQSLKQVPLLIEKSIVWLLDT
jgi:hypothetical protein